MSDFTNSIQNIARVSAIPTLISSKERQNIAEIVSLGTYDSVNFSKESQNLFQISQISQRFDDLLGVPNLLDTKDQERLNSLGSIAQNLFNQGSLSFASVDSQSILENIQKLYDETDMSKEQKDQLANLTSQLQGYLQNLSITQLFSPSEGSFFDAIGTQNNFFNQRLTDSEQSDLGKIAQQLNRLLFSSNDTQASSFLDSLNSLYGLNTPSQEEQSDIFSLLSEHNTLLASTLLNRSLTSNYSELF